MEQIINISVLSLCTVVISLLIYRVIKVQVNLKHCVGLFLQSQMDNHMIRMEMEKLVEQNASAELSQSDGFLKFLSTSRDWAFAYIEQVQDALSEFDHTINEITEWNRTYGTALGDNLFSKKIEEISLAYERLQSLLPKDNETPNN
jgi:hypothetical protein